MKCLFSYFIASKVSLLSPSADKETEVSRGCLFTHPSPHSQVELAFSKNSKFCGLSEAPSKQQGPPADGTKPLCQTAQEERRVYLASSLWLHPSEGGFGPAQSAQASQDSLTRSSSFCLVSWSLDRPSTWKANLLPHVSICSETGGSWHRLPNPASS